MTDIHKTFCLNLTRLRNERGITQEKFAEKMDTSVRYAQSLEYGYKEGKNWPSPAKLKQISRILKCDTVDFFVQIKKS